MGCPNTLSIKIINTDLSGLSLSSFFFFFFGSTRYKSEDCTNPENLEKEEKNRWIFQPQRGDLCYKSYIFFRTKKRLRPTLRTELCSVFFFWSEVNQGSSLKGALFKCCWFAGLEKKISPVESGRRALRARLPDSQSGEVQGKVCETKKTGYNPLLTELGLAPYVPLTV